METGSFVAALCTSLRNEDMDGLLIPKPKLESNPDSEWGAPKKFLVLLACCHPGMARKKSWSVTGTGLVDFVEAVLIYPA